MIIDIDNHGEWSTSGVVGMNFSQELEEDFAKSSFNTNRK